MSKRDINPTSIEEFFVGKVEDVQIPKPSALLPKSVKPKPEKKKEIRTVAERQPLERSNEGTNDRGRENGIIAELLNPTPKRYTERYSFEIYSDQREAIDSLARDYHNKTNKLLNKSEIIRLALDQFLKDNNLR